MHQGLLNWLKESNGSIRVVTSVANRLLLSEQFLDSERFGPESVRTAGGWEQRTLLKPVSRTRIAILSCYHTSKTLIECHMDHLYTKGCSNLQFELNRRECQ